MDKVDEVALAMLNAVRVIQKMPVIPSLDKLAKEAQPLWRLKAKTAIEMLATQ